MVYQLQACVKPLSGSASPWAAHMLTYTSTYPLEKEEEKGRTDEQP